MRVTHAHASLVGRNISLICSPKDAGLLMCLLQKKNCLQVEVYIIKLFGLDTISVAIQLTVSYQI